jgi:hypothetical protein
MNPNPNVSISMNVEELNQILAALNDKKVSIDGFVQRIVAQAQSQLAPSPPETRNETNEPD